MSRPPGDQEDTPLRPTAAERRQHSRIYPDGVVPVIDDPELLPDEDDEGGFSPYDEPIRPSRRDRESVLRAQRDLDVPVLPMELSAVIKRLERRILNVIADKHQEVERLRGTIDGPSGLVAVVSRHEQVVGPARSAASWALRGVVAAIIVVCGFLYRRGSEEQRVTDEIQVLREQAKEIKAELAQLRQKDTRP